MTPRLSTSQGRIIRALALYLSKDGKNLMKGGPDGMIVESVVSEPWASLTFAGERHHLVIHLPSRAVAGGAITSGAIDGADIAVARAIVAVERAAWRTDTAGARLTLDLLAIAESS